MSRVAFALASLQNLSWSAYKQQEYVLSDAKQFEARMKHVMAWLTMAGKRLAKLSYLRPHIMEDLAGDSQGKYGGVKEWDYYVLEGLYLLNEINYGNVFLLRVMTQYNPSLQYLKLVPSQLYHCKKKNKIAKKLFEKVKCSISTAITDSFYTQNKQFYKFIPYMWTWFTNYYYKIYEPERKRTMVQLNLDLFVIGNEVLPKLEEQTNFLGTMIKSKYTNDIQKHLYECKKNPHFEKQGEIKYEFSKFQDEFKKSHPEDTPDVVRKHFATESGFILDEDMDAVYGKQFGLEDIGWTNKDMRKSWDSSKVSHK